jgi:hypothetical protein
MDKAKIIFQIINILYRKTIKYFKIIGWLIILIILAVFISKLKVEDFADRLEEEINFG